MNDQGPTICIPSDVLDAIAERVADLVIERLGDELRPTSGRWMRTREAADYLGLTRSALYSRIGDVPHHKIDRLLLFKRDDLDQWLAQHRREPGNPQSWVPRAPPVLRSRPRKRTSPVELLPVGPKQGSSRSQPKAKREQPLPPPIGGDEAHKANWAYQLEITREELDAMSPREFNRAWDARNERMRAGGVFERIGELYDTVGAKAVDELQPSQLIQAVRELDKAPPERAPDDRS